MPQNKDFLYRPQICKLNIQNENLQKHQKHD